MTDDAGLPVADADVDAAETPGDLAAPAEPGQPADRVGLPGAPGEPGEPEEPWGPEADEPWEPAATEASGSSDARTSGLRLARLHLRMGSLALARAELEAFAARGHLDRKSLVDLAEACWRTGDLARAGEAASAAIDGGLEDPLALVIAAEAVAAVGRPAEARRLAGRALVVVGGSIDVLFAGMPRSAVWPDGVAEDGDAVESLAVAPGVTAGAADRGRGPSAAAAEAFAGGRAALAAGDVVAASLRLGVALRLDPAFARDVLAAIGERAAEPALALVAGDALRLLGHEAEALAAYDMALGRVDSGGPVRDPGGSRPATGVATDVGEASRHT